MKINPARSGRSELLAVFKQAIGEATVVHRQDPGRLYSLRCSQLPYCPRSVVLNYAQRGMFHAMDMRMAYYVGVGHAVHHVMQSYLSTSGQLLADYECGECGTKYPFSHQHECCGFPTRYEEVLIDYKGIVGHIDAIFRDRLGRYWIVDFKTTSLKSAPLKMKDPGANYTRQVRAYAYLLWKQYGLKVHGAMLMFLPRDTPWEPTVWEHVMKDTDWGHVRQELAHDRQLHRLTMAATTEQDFRSLFKHTCGGPYCEACKMDTKSLLRRVMQKAAQFPIKKSKTQQATPTTRKTKTTLKEKAHV